MGKIISGDGFSGLVPRTAAGTATGGADVERLLVPPRRWLARGRGASESAAPVSGGSLEMEDTRGSSNEKARCDRWSPTSANMVWLSRVVKVARARCRERGESLVWRSQAD